MVGTVESSHAASAVKIEPIERSRFESMAPIYAVVAHTHAERATHAKSPEERIERRGRESRSSPIGSEPELGMLKTRRIGSARPWQRQYGHFRSALHSRRNYSR